MSIAKGRDLKLDIRAARRIGNSRVYRANDGKLERSFERFNGFVTALPRPIFQEQKRVLQQLFEAIVKDMEIVG